MANFKKLFEYCVLQNHKENTPHFLIVNNPDFEYVACLHSPQYHGQDIHGFMKNVFDVKDIASFKSNADIYGILNSGEISYQVMLDSLRNKEKFIKMNMKLRKRILKFVLKIL